MSEKSTSSRGARCLECREALPPRAENPFFPFCSTRCKQVDLGKWLNEEHHISVSREETERRFPDEDDLS